MREDNRRLIDRRTALKGLGASLISTTGVVSAADTKYTKITTAIGKTDTETKLVPKKWWNREQQADRALVELRNRLKNEPIQSICLTRSDQKVAGRYVTQIKVYPHPSFSGTIPDTIKGIPVLRGSYRGQPGLSNHRECFFNNDYSYASGGMFFESPDSDSWGSLGCRVTRNGNTRFITANHVFGDCDANGNEKGTQHDDVVGDVTYQPSDQDWCLLADTGDMIWTDEILEENDTRVVGGHVTRDGLKDAMANNETVYKAGAALGTKSGTIDSIDDTLDFGCVYIGDAVYSSAENAKGDSGGPVYKSANLADGDVAIVSLTNGYHDSDDTNDTDCGGSTVYSHTVGSPAYRMHNNHGVYFG